MDRRKLPEPDSERTDPLRRNRPLVVLLANNPLAIEPRLLQPRADIIHHCLQPADEYVQIAPFADRLKQMLLHVPRPPAPLGSRTAERRPVPKIRVPPRELFKFRAIK